MVVLIGQYPLGITELPDGCSMTFVSQLPWLSLVVALLALFIAYNNYRLSHTVVVQVIGCESSYTYSVSDGQYYHFTIYLRNIGIPLHDVGMSLSFRPLSTGGSATLPIRTRDNQIRREGQFAKGMVAGFTFRSDRLDEGELNMLRSLRDTYEQAARFDLYSSGYRAWEYRLDRRRLFKRAWNRIASRFSNLVRSRRGVAPEGHEIVAYWPDIPRFLMPSNRLNYFLCRLGQPEFPFGTGPVGDQGQFGHAWRMQPPGE